MTQTAKVFMAVATLAVTVVLLLVAVGVVIITAGTRQQHTLEELKAGQEVQQSLLRQGERQILLLVECLTLPPKPGGEINEADKVHECQQETEALRTAAVARIARTNILLHECTREGAADLEACVAEKAAG